MDDNDRQRNYDRLETDFDLQRNEDYDLPVDYHVHAGQAHYTDHSIGTHAFFLDAMQQNKEPIPQPEDYTLDPVYPQEVLASLLKGYAPEPSWQFVINLPRMEQPFRGLRPNLAHSPTAIKLQPEQQQQQLPKQEQSEPREISLPPERMIGGITASQRKEKIKLYLEKRRRRSFTKKVAYDCRKKVADQRIRVKGRFVTRTQALSLLQLPEGDYSQELIKRMLTEKLPKKTQQQQQNDSQ